ncbi:efflux RND transporter periplasmic adaptor subunit [Acanthopleuribacter pedis]|uniref:Efflux RND transporter periplasmic adaptor subunit n=1 Tax=Acanthopleuribacter pedis TaxID=442870 RepID=A0A8J7Q4B3_9BACT|nr:efflux RND transporter periplasmic adaptor subunit [Acanthopleuribacter pedis]MBO1317476.1 efflux RND transporter periplasmic adaptor subunit [Acanthopleuribacter pedis]
MNPSQKFQLRTLLSAFLLISLLPVLIGGPGHDHGADDHGADDHGAENSIQDPRVLGLTLVKPKQGSLGEAFSRPAEIQFDAKRIAHLKSGLGGFVREVHSEWGRQVRKGEVLVTLESRELGEARAQFLAAAARLRLADRTYQREKSLWQDQITPEQDYLDALQAWETARINERLARQSLIAVGLTEQQIEALIQNPEGSLTHYELKAPFDGTITNQHVSQGEQLEAHDTVVTLVDAARVWVVARVPETDIHQLQVGLPMSLKLAALPGREFQGTCAYLGAELDSETRTLEVRAALANPEGVLRAGMFGEVTFFPKQKDETSTWLLPSNAVQRAEGGHQVYLVKSGHPVESLPVQVTARQGDWVAVQGPLHADQNIAVGDLFLLKSMAEKAAMGGHSH